MKRKSILLVAVVTLALGTGLILLHQLKGAEPAGGPGEPAGARGGVQKAASGPGARTQPASGPAFDANDPDVRLLVKGLNEFAIDLYKEIAKTEKGNIFFSPFSISSALAMTYAGARGKTADEIAKVLHFPPELLKDDAKRLHAAFGKLNAHLNAAKTPDGKPRGYDLITGNGLWMQVGHGFLEPFIRTNTDYYKARLAPVDFTAGGKDVVDKINAWVAEQTRGMIDRVIERSLPDTTRLVLANAVYFRGLWAQKFDKAATNEGVFHLPSGDKLNVPFMNRRGGVGFLPEDFCTAVHRLPEDCRFQEVELPYVGGELSLLILLPRSMDGIAPLERALTPGMMEGRIPEGSPVHVSLPKVALAYRTDLSPYLSRRGLRAAFDPNAADFSGMDSTRDLYMGGVDHAGRILVNEEGTEAAAVTVVRGVISVMEAPRFLADHPFLFAVMDRARGCILFLGRVTDPGIGKSPPGSQPG